MIGDARFVLIGEASHGTQDFYHARAELTKHLIERRSFTAVAAEADWPDALRVNRYVKGESGDTDRRRSALRFSSLSILDVAELRRPRVHRLAARSQRGCTARTILWLLRPRFVQPPRVGRSGPRLPGKRRPGRCARGTRALCLLRPLRTRMPNATAMRRATPASIRAKKTSCSNSLSSDETPDRTCGATAARHPTSSSTHNRTPRW